MVGSNGMTGRTERTRMHLRLDFALGLCRVSGKADEVVGNSDALQTAELMEQDEHVLASCPARSSPVRLPFGITSSNQTQEFDMTGRSTRHTGRRAWGSSLLLALPLAVVAMLALSASAFAGTPTGEFVNFGDCPLGNPAVNLCVFAQTTSGEVKIGSTAVPITKTITLQGGIIFSEEPTISETFVAATDGNTLSKSPQTVPGGLLKIVAPSFFPEPLRKIFNEFIDNGITGVTATTELVSNVGINRAALFTGEGTALSLPVRIHLENSFLGGKCFVGSAAHPVSLNLTTGTTSPPPPNTSIKGNPGEFSFNSNFTLITVKNNSLVDNSFAAPEAQGCGSQILFGLFTGIIDSAVDSQLGLPSAAGHNTAILDGQLENSSVEAVKESEK
jgi:hypothetical protein